MAKNIASHHVGNHSNVASANAHVVAVSTFVCEQSVAACLRRNTAWQIMMCVAEACNGIRMIVTMDGLSFGFARACHHVPDFGYTQRCTALATRRIVHAKPVGCRCDWCSIFVFSSSLCACPNGRASVRSATIALVSSCDLGLTFCWCYAGV